MFSGIDSSSTEAIPRDIFSNRSGITPSEKVEPSLLPDKKDEDFPEDELDNQDSYGDLNRQQGYFSVYSYYASASGRLTFISYLIFALFWAFCREFTSKSFFGKQKLDLY